MNSDPKQFSLDRKQSIRRITETDHWDIVVIGGGATGLGTALDAVSRDFNVLLLEQDDFCKSTSSRSTKLIHGGVRYLEQAEIGLVRSALRERGHLLDNAPHVVTDIEFVLPGFSFFQTLYFGLGLKVYDLLSWGYRLGSSRFLSNKQIHDKLPNLDTGSIQGGVCYRDAQFDDARLGIQLAQTIETNGGTVVNSMRVSEILRDQSRVEGVVADNLLSGETHQITADAVINATGIFTDSIRRMVNPGTAPLLKHSRGTHIVVDSRFLSGSSALLIPKTDDDRVLFAIPWKNRTLIGTTDIPVDSPDLEPKPTEDEIDYLLEHIGRHLTEPPQRNDILSTFSGLRPLVAEGSSNTSEISRDHHVEVDDSGLVTVTGGKWTTFREMGEDAVNQAINHRGLDEVSSHSDEIHIHGYTDSTGERSPLAAWGSDRKRIEQFLEDRPELQEKLHPALPYPRGIVPWCTRHEMARGIEDILSRRTRSLLLDARAAVESAEDVAKLMAEELNHGEEWKKNQVREFKQLAENYIPD